MHMHNEVNTSKKTLRQVIHRESDGNHHTHPGNRAHIAKCNRSSEYTTLEERN